MSFPSIVRISRPGGEGSGVFIAEDLVITAGHVLQPPSAEFDPEDYRVLVGGIELEVKAVRCLERWSHGRLPSADMGVLRIRAKRPGFVASWRVDPKAEQLAVRVGGSNAQQYHGTVTRVPGEAAFDMFESSDLAFPSGVSGGPIVDVAGTVLGIATRSSSSPNAGLLVGLPLLAETFGWLRDNCP
jgi:S1-C subfamily serine protease